MNIYITGASGFVGTNFIADTPFFTHFEVDLLKNNVEDLSLINADCVLHLAALVHQMNGAAKDEYFRINSDLAFDMALKSKKNGVKHFILMSTIKVYGEATEDGVWTEFSKCNPVDDYGKSKLDAESRILELADQNFIVSIVRSPLIYGKGVKGNMISLVKLTDKFRFLPFAKINNKRSFVFIKNLSALIEAIINQTKPGVFLASDSKSVSTTDLIYLISKSLNKNIKMIYLNKKIISILKILAPSKVERLWGNLEINSKRHIELNFIPPFSIEYGIKDMVDWYLLNKKTN